MQEDKIDERWAELKISGKNLQGRSYHTLVRHGGKIYTYGGYEVDKGILGDFYEMEVVDVEEYMWKKVRVENEGEVNPGK